MLNFIREECFSWMEGAIRNLPGRAGRLVRRMWYQHRFAGCGELFIGEGCRFIDTGAMRFEGRTLINEGCYFNAQGGGITVGDFTAFNNGVHINASCGGHIRIGSHCPIGPGVVMRTANHRFSNADEFIQNQGHEAADITIEDDCWLGANVIVLGGVKIGRGAVVGAGAVVSKDVPEMAVVVGVPARVINYRLGTSAQTVQSHPEYSQ
jgi:acetyltransferase-like isoleucine patch superfamily enzyme